MKREPEKPTEKMSSNIDLTAKNEGVKKEGSLMRAATETLTNGENK